MYICIYKHKLDKSICFVWVKDIYFVKTGFVGAYYGCLFGSFFCINRSLRHIYLVYIQPPNTEKELQHCSEIGIHF